ncbi:MAG TPA: hypothetical protein PLU22_10690, partial [Polyangiaceae bacterium]|nr:hypothetical protein [Polyangiaceae bacterium]
ADPGRRCSGPCRRRAGARPSRPMASRWSARLRSGAFALLGALVVAACDDDDGPLPCRSGDCACPPGERCGFVCAAPPCSVLCVGDNPECNGDCANGDCVCGPDSRCTFSCAAEPCHVTCDPGSACFGTCGNGTCTCGAGSDCVFACRSGPCHVECEGDNPRCDGTCANGTCRCAAGSTCRFACSDGDCAVECPAGAACVLDCPAGDGGSACTFRECGGTATVCPGGTAVTCDADCPG